MRYSVHFNISQLILIIFALKLLNWSETLQVLIFDIWYMTNCLPSEHLNVSFYSQSHAADCCDDEDRRCRSGIVCSKLLAQRNAHNSKRIKDAAALSCCHPDFKCTHTLALWLKTHLKMHSGEKPNTCSQLQFEQSDTMHRKLHLDFHLSHLLQLYTTCL